MNGSKLVLLLSVFFALTYYYNRVLGAGGAAYPSKGKRTHKTP
jgi:hypothetical protein